jgi:putative transposase
MQNGYIERFNRTFRQDVLDTHLFSGIDKVRVIAENWMDDYNFSRPHEDLDGITPYQAQAKFSSKQACFDEN